MIISVSDFKLFQQVSVSTFDTLIKKLIPVVEAKIINYCNNEFVGTYQSTQGIMPTVYTYSNSISFANSDNSMNDSENDFTSLNFKVGDSVRVYNSLHNDKPLTIESIATNKIIFEDVNTIADESAGNTIVMARIDYPVELELVASQMIKYNLQKQGYNLKSEKIDDYSYTKDDKLVSGYPSSIMEGLDDYRSMFLKTIPYNTLYYRLV